MGVLDEKVAIVTGSARGIGRATAELLAEHGAKVLINDLDGQVAGQAAAEIDGETEVFAGDLTKPGVPDDLVAKAIDTFGRIDIIVNNAGYTLDAPVHKMSDDWFQKMLDIHVVAPFRVIRAAAPHLREPAKLERADGREVFRKIVNVSSISGTMGNAGQANYAAGKSAVVGLTKTLAKEWGQFKVNVNAVAFGYIETRLTASKDESNTMEIDGQKVQLGIPDQLRGMVPMLIPLGRPGTPREAAGGVFFLCSPWANYVHGQVLNVTGSSAATTMPRGPAARTGFRVALLTVVATLAFPGIATARRPASRAETSAMWRVADPAGRCVHRRGTVSTVRAHPYQYGAVTVADSTCGNATYVLRRQRDTGSRGRWRIVLSGSDIGAPGRCRADLRKLPPRVLHDLLPRVGCPPARSSAQM